jgi:hypothetical protein
VLALAALVGSSGLLASGGAVAEPGIAGFSSPPGCINGCHHPNASPTLTPQIVGPAQVAPSSITTYSVALPQASSTAMGIDIAASAGTLSTGSSSTYLMSGEIVEASDAVVSSYDFNWAAPTAPGSYALHGCALVQSGSTETTGCTLLQVTVAGPATPALPLPAQALLSAALVGVGALSMRRRSQPRRGATLSRA